MGKKDYVVVVENSGAIPHLPPCARGGDRGGGEEGVERSKGAREVAMKTDGKILFLLSFLYFLVETESGSENTGTETGSGYAENTDVEPERITRPNNLEYILTKSQNNIHVRSY